MMIAATGSSTDVSGKRIAMAAVGPSPGRTPTSVPRSEPTKAMNRFVGVSAAANPFARCGKTSMASGAEEPGGQRLEQPHAEEQVEHGGGHGAQQGGGRPAVSAHGSVQRRRRDRRARGVPEPRDD